MAALAFRGVVAGALAAVRFAARRTVPPGPPRVRGAAYPGATVTGVATSMRLTAPGRRARAADVVIPRPAPASGSATADPSRRRSAHSDTRLRIVASFLVLLVIFAAASLFGIRQVLVLRLEHRVDDALRQEVLELERLRADGRDPTNGRAFNSLNDLFDVYFARNVPGNEEAMLAFVGGRLQRSHIARFPLDALPAAPLAVWAAASSTLSPSRVEGLRSAGTFRTELGTARYRLANIRYDDGSASFVVAILPAAELQEIEDLQTYGTGVTILVLLVAAASTWFVAGRALAPIRQLTSTARAISESDLAQRIDVRGSDEAAEMAQSFNSMLDRLEGVFHSERQFVKDAGHELRDPLTICLGYLGQLESAPAQERAQMIAVVTDELDRMGRIVNDLQHLAEAEQPDFLRTESIDLALLAHELTVKASALAPRDWRLEHEAEGMITADRHRLTEAVMNLAHNAVEHTVEGAVIALGVSADGPDVRLWVRDEGVGVPVAEQAQIFERFTRGEASRRRYRGGGLGLAIVRTIAEAHGGRAELTSRFGVGSTFTIVLPRGPGRASA